MTTTTRLLAAVLCTVLVAACGGSASSGSSSGLTKLRVVQSSKSVGYFAMHVAQQQGYFKDEGVDVGEPSVLGGDSKVAAAIAGGAADVGGGVVTDAFQLADAHRNPRIVATLLNSYYIDVIVGKQFKQPPAGSSMETKIRALKGARIGVPAPSGGGAALLQFLFNKVGMDLNRDVTMVNLGGSNTGAVGALKTDRVNALAFFQPVSQQIVADGLGSIYISPTRGDIPDMVDQPHSAAITTDKTLKQKSKALAGFVRAIARAEKLIQTDPAKTKDLLTKYDSSLEPKTVDALIPVLQKEVPGSPVLTSDGYAKALRFHQLAGLAKQPPDYATMTGNQFADQAVRK